MNHYISPLAISLQNRYKHFLLQTWSVDLVCLKHTEPLRLGSYCGIYLKCELDGVLLENREIVQATSSGKLKVKM